MDSAMFFRSFLRKRATSPFESRFHGRDGVAMRSSSPASASAVCASIAPQFVCLPHMQSRSWPVLEVRLACASEAADGAAAERLPPAHFFNVLKKSTSPTKSKAITMASVDNVISLLTVIYQQCENVKALKEACSAQN